MTPTATLPSRFVSLAALLTLAACGGSSQQQAPAAAPGAAQGGAAANSAAQSRPPQATPAEPEAGATPGTAGEVQVASATATEPQPASEGSAEEAAPEAAPKDPAQAQALLAQGRAVVQERGEGGAEDAVKIYLEAIDNDGTCAACWWELGWAYQLLTDFAQNVAAWDEVKKLEPNFPELAQHYPVAVMRKEQAEALAALPDPGQLPPPELEPFNGPTLTVRAVGDVQMGMAWPEHKVRLPPNDGMDMFEHVKPILADAHVTFGNLETVLMDEGPSTKCGPKSTKCFAFRVPTSFAKALKDAGFDVLSIANNHAGDFGEAGRKTTMEALDAVGIHHSGPIGDLASWEANGLRIGLVAFSTGGGVYRVQEIDTAQRVVADLARKHDIVIVSFHGGAEGASAAHVPQGTEMFLGENRGDLRTFSRAVIDAGADLVLGHGPHLLRGMEIYQGRLIAYSLGNFSTWETFSLRGPLGVTGILDVELAPNGVLLKAKLHPGVIKKPGRPQPDPSGQAIKAVRKLSKEDFGDALFDKDGVWVRPKPEA